MARSAGLAFIGAGFVAFAWGCTNDFDSFQFFPDASGGSGAGMTTTGTTSSGGASACSTADDCPGADTNCQSRTCNSKMCGLANAPVGTGCTESGGKVCNGMGECVACAVDGDCTGGKFCSSGSCVDPTCGDTKKNGKETDVDCGGPDCKACENGKDCLVAGDCETIFCEQGNGGSGGSGSGGAGGAGGAGGVDFNYEPTGGAGGEETCAAVEVKGAKTPVDIVFAIDTSGSMSTEIAQVKANINGSFAAELAKGELDYRVTMIAAKGTSTFQVCVAPPLGGANCASNLPIYQAVPQTVGSTNALSLILSTYDSANVALNWSGFARYDATKALVVITDDNSTLAAASFDTSLLAKPPAGMFGTAQKRKYIVYGIIGITDGNPAIKCPAAVNNGPVYQTLVALTKGAMYSECNADYSPVFKQLAGDLATQLSCEYTLPLNDPNGKAIDPEKVAIAFLDPNNVETAFPHVTDASKCNGVGWYYENNNAPTKVILCPDACTQVQGASGGEVKIKVGCLKG